MQQKRYIACFEKLSISTERKKSIYEKFDDELIKKSVQYYYNQKKEPKDIATFIEEICKRRLMKRALKQKWLNVVE